MSTLNNMTDEEREAGYWGLFPLAVFAEIATADKAMMCRFAKIVGKANAARLVKELQDAQEFVRANF